MAIREYWIEVLDEPTVALYAAHIVMPCLKTHRHQVGQQRSLNLCVAQILRVVPEVARLCALISLQAHEALQMPLVRVEGFLGDRGRRRRSPHCSPKCSHQVGMVCLHASSKRYRMPA